MIKEIIPPTSPTSQAKHQSITYQLDTPLDPTEIFQEKRGQCVHHVINLLLKKLRWSRKIRIPLAYIEKVTGYKERTIRYAIEWLEDNNVIRVLRDMYDVNIYYLTDYYRDPKVFNAVMKYLTGWFIFSTSFLVCQPDCRLICLKDNFIINPSLPIQVHLQRARAREGRDMDKEKREVMSVVEWGNAIKELNPKFPLTDHGIAKLSAFPAEVIRYAMTRMPMVYKAYDPFAYFIKVCKSYCTEKGIREDWEQCRKLKQIQNVDENDPCLDVQALQVIIAEESEAPKYQKRGYSKDKAPDAAALKARQEATNELIREREAKAAQPEANRDEVVAGIMAQDWSDSKKKKALEFLDLAWPLGEQPDIMAAVKNTLPTVPF